MAKITAADIQRDLLESQIKLGRISSMIQNVENTYTRLNASFKTTESLLKVVSRSIKDVEEEYDSDIEEQQETTAQKVRRVRLEEDKNERELKKDLDVNRTLMAALMGAPTLATAGSLSMPSDDTEVEDEDQTGENGKLSPSQLIAVGQLSSSPEGGPYWYGNTAYLRPDAARAFIEAQQAAAVENITIVINSAYRSYKHQEALVGKYAVVAKPGTSPHGLGIALDIETGAGWNWMTKNGMKYGWKWMAIPNDEVHFEYVGGGSAEPAESTKYEEISKSTNGSKLGLVVAEPQTEPPPQTILQEPQYFAPRRIALNTYKPHPFFTTPTG